MRRLRKMFLDLEERLTRPRPRKPLTGQCDRGCPISMRQRIHDQLDRAIDAPPAQRGAEYRVLAEMGNLIGNLTVPLCDRCPLRTKT